MYVRQPPNLRVLKQILFLAHFTFPPQGLREVLSCFILTLRPMLSIHHPEHRKRSWHQLLKHLSWSNIATACILPAKACSMVTPNLKGKGSPILPCAREKQNHVASSLSDNHTLIDFDPQCLFKVWTECPVSFLSFNSYLGYSHDLC